METYRLIRHASFAPKHITGVSVRWSQLPDGRVMLRYKVEGCTTLVVPPAREAARADELWKTTCCELFLYDGSGTYREYNFSPSGEWAAWRFSGYRNGREDIDPVAEPEILAETGNNLFLLTVFLAGEEFAGGAVRRAQRRDAGGRPAAQLLGAGPQQIAARFPRSILLPHPTWRAALP